MIPPIQFFCDGIPAPGGSKNFFPLWQKGGRLIIRMQNGREWPAIRVVDAAGQKNAEWKAAVQIQARAVMQSQRPYDCPFMTEFTFYLPRPLSHYGTGRNAEILKPAAPRYHTNTPDVLKFARSTEDALTGVIWHDDSSNVRMTAEKRYMQRGDRQGCLIRVTFLSSIPPAPSQCPSSSSPSITTATIPLPGI